MFENCPEEGELLESKRFELSSLSGGQKGVNCCEKGV